ncbi:MAG: DNA methyltransferase [Aestuariivita sp.]|nr:DNA methyltransferase [Aestuariivita sp.]MCY4203463.1 DNA methyltransferase [Aestuariivita sp.]
MTQPSCEMLAGDWTFREADTKTLTHGIHPYPAKMIPQVASRLINIYGNSGGVIFDPYCGSGTTLLEAMLAGMNAIGTDLNPLARLISRVKTHPISISLLDEEISRFPKSIPDKNCPLPYVTNINYWFAKQVQSDLAAIRKYIDAIEKPTIADVFRVAFSIAVRKSSWVRQGEFKLYRMSDKQIKAHKVEPFALMLDALIDIRQRLFSLKNIVSTPRLPPAIHGFNTVDGIPKCAVVPCSVDLVVTSPPYGDSRTTVAYGQFSRLSAEWLGFPDASRMDNLLMGGGKVAKVQSFDVPTLDAVIAGISGVHRDRAREVAAFFADYRASIGNVAALVKNGGYICYVVADRTVKGSKIPMADTTAAFFAEQGFKSIAVPTRTIPNKRMPSLNSPTNVSGKIGKTITVEKIVICQKVT